MSERTAYEIVLRGRPSNRLLRPLLDDFDIDTSVERVTRLRGSVADAAHLHGLVKHLTSVNVELVSIAPVPTHEGSTMTTTIHAPVADTSVAAPTVRPLMRAITQERYGSADVLELAEIPRPSAGADEVVIEVVAAAVDRGTCHLMSGTPYLIRLAGFGLFRPNQQVVGLDVAGRVVAVGDDVTRFQVGDEVFGVARGSLAEFATAAESELALKPSNVSFEHAAATTVSGATALQALVDVGKLEAGQRVLVIGASGGVGSFTVQLAKAFGAEVTGVASTRNLDLVRSLGADHVIDYTAEDFAKRSERYDLIIDIGGRNSVSRMRRVLDRTGTLVITGGEGGNKVTGGLGRQLWAVIQSPFRRQRLTMFISSTHHSTTQRLAVHLESGAITPAVEATFPLDRAAEAIALLDAGNARGKNVITVADRN